MMRLPCRAGTAQCFEDREAVAGQGVEQRLFGVEQVSRQLRLARFDRRDGLGERGLLTRHFDDQRVHELPSW
jgi:hypothetical protein